MATCVKAVTTYTHSTSSTNSALVASIVYQPDTTTPLSTCGQMLIAPAEYQDLQHGYITTRADAEQIAGALALLLAIGFIYKAIRSALDMNVEASDEKH